MSLESYPAQTSAIPCLKSVSPGSPILHQQLRTHLYIGLLLLSVPLLGLIGCTTTMLRPEVIDVSEISREKDVKTFMVSLKKFVPRQQFQQWTKDHIEQNRLEIENPDHENIPIFELHYHFVHRSGRFRTRRIAYVMWRRSEDNPDRFEHQFTYLGSGIPMQSWRSR